MFDVAVVGAGPAGATAAHLLADAGMRVVLLEKAALPRPKTCGGGVVGRAAQWLAAEVAPAVEHTCSTATISLRGKRLVTCRRDVPLIRMTMRSTFDALLAEAAAAAGADLRAPARVTTIASDEHGVHLTTSRGSVEAAFVICADGATSPVSRQAGWSPAHGAIPALEMEAEVDDATLSRFQESARFDFGLPPDGYAWVFPKAAHLSIGVLSTRRGSIKLRAVLAAYLQRLGITPLGGDIRGAVIPIRPVRGPWMRNRVLVVGDAGGFVDPLLAEGISAAALSGRLAAAAIAENALDPARTARAYHAKPGRCRQPSTGPSRPRWPKRWPMWWPGSRRIATPSPAPGCGWRLPWGQSRKFSFQGPLKTGFLKTSRRFG
jgi:geranylgeranyl reductase family protein